MKSKIILLVLFLAAITGVAADYRTFTLTTGTNAASAVTNYAESFAGNIVEISVYTASGATGAVAIAAIDPWRTNALVLATNAAVSGSMTWRPRVEAPAVGGATALSITNQTTTSEPFRAQGEQIRAIVSEANLTSSVFRVWLKID